MRLITPAVLRKRLTTANSSCIHFPEFLIRFLAKYYLDNTEKRKLVSLKQKPLPRIDTSHRYTFNVY